jgi:outer membrane protein
MPLVARDGNRAIIGRAAVNPPQQERNMTRSLAAILVSLLAAILVSLLAATPAAAHADNLKLGYVDVAKVLSTSKAGKGAKEQLEKQVKERQAKVDAEKSALEKMKADYEKNTMDLTERQKQAKQKEFQEKNERYQKAVAEARKEVGEKDADLTRKVVEQMRGVIASVGKAEDFVLVVEKTATSVLYSRDGLDLTDRVIRQMDGQK